MAKFDVKVVKDIDFDVELRNSMSEVASGKAIIDDNLFNSEETGIFVFRNEKTITFLKKNKKMVITMNSEEIDPNNSPNLFINKIKVVNSATIKKLYFIYYAYANNEDLLKRYRENHIEFIKFLNGDLLPGMTSSCFNITENVDEFIK